METFGKFVVGIIVWVMMALLIAHVFTQLWLWFMVPTFGLPVLTYAQALGIHTLKSMLFAKVSKHDKDDTFGETIMSAFSLMFQILVGYGIGWIVSLFM